MEAALAQMVQIDVERVRSHVLYLANRSPLVNYIVRCHFSTHYQI